MRQCENVANIGFLMDSSVSKLDYETQKTLVQRVIEAYPISERGNRVGVVVYRDDAEVSIPFKSKWSHSDIKEMVRAMPHIKRPSNVLKALETARQSLLPTGSTGQPTILVLLTSDGEEGLIDSRALAPTLQSLKSASVPVIVVSFGQPEASDTTKSIAKSSLNLFHTIDAKKLTEAEFVAPLVKRMCKLGKNCLRETLGTDMHSSFLSRPMSSIRTEING